MAILWVNKDHVNASDSTTKANNSESLPWATPLRALWGNTTRDSAPTTAQAATQGDTVRIVKPADGFYEFSRGAHDESAGACLVPCNSGASGSPIIIEAYGLTGDFGEDFIELKPDATSAGDVIGGYDISVDEPTDLDMGYFEWRGFKLGIGVGATTGHWPCFFQGVHHCLVEYCSFDGGGAQQGPGSNHNATRAVCCNDITVRNCYFTGFYAGDDDDENGNACEVYDSGGIIFEHNYVTDCGTGVFYKAPNTSASPTSQQWDVAPHIIRYNHFHACGQGPIPHRISEVDEANGVYIYQNLITNIVYTCFRFRTFQAGENSPHHTKFFNNTIYSAEVDEPISEIIAGDDTAMEADMAGVVQNNVIKVARSIEVLHCADTLASFTGGTGKIAWDRNAYDTPRASTGNFFEGATNASYASWTDGGVQDPNSVVGTVTFVSATPSAAADFKLADNGQDALTLGRVLYNIGGTTGATIPAGCYISGSEVIGIQPFDGGGVGASSKAPRGVLRRGRRVM